MNTINNIETLPEYVKKYLLRSGNAKWKLELSDDKKYKMAVVIPAIMEYENIRRLLFSLLQNHPRYFDRCVFIFVVNNLTDSRSEVKEDNLNSLNLIRKIISKNTSSDELILEVVGSGLNIGVVDAASDEFQFDPKVGGVGFARKVGMDLALTIFDYENTERNILLCLDADCTVDSNYITKLFEAYQNEYFKAAYIKFRHNLLNDEIVNVAIICYEIFLRYFVLGLRAAGSHFAIHSVGSTLSCDVDSYIKIGGMNKKKAGEDFYFIEKLAKAGKVGYINTTTVYPAGRSSWRVPFGTGQRVTRFNSRTHNEYQLYSFRSFLLLKKWLELFHSDKILSAHEYLSGAANIHQSLKLFLLENSFADEWEKICKNSKTENQINKQKILWFDGFKTLKFIHFLRDTTFPDENMFDVLDTAFAYIGIEFPVSNDPGSIPSVDVQIKYLDALRTLV